MKQKFNSKNRQELSLLKAGIMFVLLLRLIPGYSQNPITKVFEEWHDTSGSQDMYARSIVRSKVISGTNFYYTAGSTLNSSGVYDIFIRKTTAAGAVVWQKTWNGGSGDAVCGDVQISNWGGDQTQSTQGITWSTFYGGGNQDMFYDVRVMTSGEVVAVGKTTSSNFPTTTGVVYQTHIGGTDCVVVKFHPGGAREWSTYYGGSTSWNSPTDIARAVDVDGTGRVLFTGLTVSSNFPLQTWGSAYYQATAATGSGHAFIAALSSTGQSKVWSTYYGGNGGPGGEEGWDLRISPTNGDIYMVGYGSTGVPLDSLPGAYNWNTPGGLITRFNTVGVPIWATYFGSSNSYKCVLHGVTIDGSGDVVVVGHIQDSTGFPVTPGAFSTTYNGGAADCFAAKFSGSSSALVWCTYLGGNGNETANGIERTKNDINTSYYITGFTASTTGFPITNPGNNAYVDSTYNGGTNDAFVIELDQSGGVTWATYYGGTAEDNAYAVTLDAANNVYITGETKSTNITLPSPNLTNAYVASSIDGTQDAFVTGFQKQNRKLLWSTYYGGANGEESRSVECSGDTSLYIVGWVTTASDFPLVAGTSTQYGSRYYDDTVSGSKAFISMLDISPVIIAGNPTTENNSSEFNVYPNPSNIGVWLSFGNKKEGETTIEIFDATGKLVFSSKYHNPDNSTIYIDVSKLQNGMYLIRASDKESCSTKKFLIQK